MIGADQIYRASGPSGDPADKLPPRAREKFTALRAQHEDAGAAIRQLSERQAAISQRRLHARDYVARLRESAQRGHGSATSISPYLTQTSRDDRPAGAVTPHHGGPASKNQVEQAEAELQAVEREASEVNGRLEKLTARRSPIVDRTWLRDLPPGSRLSDATNLPTLSKGARATPAAVEAARVDLSRLRARLNEVRAAPITSKEALAILARQVEALAARGEADVLRVTELGVEAKFPTVIVTNPHSGVQVEIVDTAGLVAWLHKDVLLEKLGAAVREIADDRAALSSAEREAQERQITAQIEAAERMELLIETAALDGLDIPRRGDANPAIVLGVSVVTA